MRKLFFKIVSTNTIKVLNLQVSKSTLKEKIKNVLDRIHLAKIVYKYSEEEEKRLNQIYEAAEKYKIDLSFYESDELFENQGIETKRIKNNYIEFIKGSVKYFQGVLKKVKAGDLYRDTCFSVGNEVIKFKGSYLVAFYPNHIFREGFLAEDTWCKVIQGDLVVQKLKKAGALVEFDERGFLKTY
ncbi:MAG: hypothetical protein KKA19_04980 [Candidatus Margulisbacteria bacterium]|nr:hypothetical protein [Candidatus Margulisiibacteriota bacterium]